MNVLILQASPRAKGNTAWMAADSWMQHLAIHTQEQPGATNEWLEPVSDTQYNSLQ